MIPERTWKIWKETIRKNNELKKDNSGKEEPEKGESCTGKNEKGQF